MSTELAVQSTDHEEDSMPSENPFSKTPTSSSIENTFRMGQVLRKRNDLNGALDKYFSVCELTEKIVAMNPGANVEMQWTMFSLGEISDIYYSKVDYNKSLLFRNVQQDLIKLIGSMKTMQEGMEGSDDEPSVESFSTFASRGHSYTQLFAKYHEAKDAQDRPPPEDPAEFVKKLQEARKKDEEAKIEETIRLLNQASDEREKELKNSFWKRTGKRISDHPAIFMLIVVAIVGIMLAVVLLQPKRKSQVPSGIDAQMEYLEKYVKDYEAKHGPIKKPKLNSRKKQRPKYETDHNL